jgi:hypothetical protein
MFQVTDELLINVNKISAITTSIETSRLSKEKSKWIISQGKDPDIYYEVEPYISVYIDNNGFYVKGFTDIYNLLSSFTSFPSRVWDALIRKVNICLEGNEKEIGILLSEEDKEYLTKKI